MKKTLLFLLVFLIILLIGYYGIQNRYSSQYQGEIELQGLQEETSVLFDTYGVPHIYAAQMEDAYQALGYVHAQDRLFQMEMMRRVGTGTLAELLGADLLEVDQFFRTLGIPKHAQWSTEVLLQSGESEWRSATDAYIKGVNQFIQQGRLPLEYTLLGAEPRTFELNDIHAILGYMSFTFGMAIKTDPLITRIHRQLGPKYLKDLAVHTLPEDHRMTLNYPPLSEDSQKTSVENSLTSLLEKLPVPLWEGSNSWVLAADRTASGEVMFCNDTHIGFAQPSVWYEAHLEYPGFSYYGNHLAGIPFGLIGHTERQSIGLTMLENDDQDFFEEQLNPENPNETIHGSGFHPIQSRIESIPIKGQDPVDFEIRTSFHGPILNGVVPEIAALTDRPVASWWVYLLEPTKVLEATWKLGKSENMQEVEQAVRLIHAPGLNVMYGDKEGNIAWWGAAKLPLRPDHVNSKLFIDGSDPENEPLGWIPFEENPMSINPEIGFVASANNQPDTLSNGNLYPGYYVPGDRWNMIAETLATRTDWDQESMKSIQNESIMQTQADIGRDLLEAIDLSAYQDHEKILRSLQNWDGSHHIQQTAPTLYYKWIYHTLRGMMADELGEAGFQNYLDTFMATRSTAKLIRSSDSIWWDDITTPDTETRAFIIRKALDKSLSELRDQLGKNTDNWKWEKVVRLEHPHPLGSQKPLDRIFNVKAPAVDANETSINKMAFKFNGEGIYQVNSGPAMRIILDFANVDASESILPTGQSGNLFSPWYKDQTEMFAQGKYRPQLMNETEIKAESKYQLTFVPQP